MIPTLVVYGYFFFIFRKWNIGQQTLAELSEEDLIKLGVDDAEVRLKILNEVKNLPIYEESKQM